MMTAPLHSHALLRKPHVAPNKISFKAFEHDIITQWIALEWIANSPAEPPEAAFENELWSLVGKQPDAVVDGIAIEIENEEKIIETANGMLFRLQILIDGDRVAGQGQMIHPLKAYWACHLLQSLTLPYISPRNSSRID